MMAMYDDQMENKRTQMEIFDDEFSLLDPQDNLPEDFFLCIGQGKVVTVPKLQSMTDYIKRHYQRNIVDMLCTWINQGYAWDIDQQNCLEAIVDTGRITKASYWMEDRETVIADIVLEIDVEMLCQGIESLTRHSYHVRVVFDLNERVAYREGSFDVYTGPFMMDGYIPLTEHLIPVVSKAGIEEAAESILRKYLPEALEDQKKNNPMQLAEKMGLEVEYLPLHKSPKTKSILFLKAGTITIELEDDETKQKWTKSVRVGANTIVINTNAVREDWSRLYVYHECVHYELHNLFYRLQELHNDDLKQIKKQKVIKYDRRGMKDPLSWIEWQANRGSYGLMMPISFIRPEINTRLKNQASCCAHLGKKYDYIARHIAGDFDLPKYRVRARMIQLGHIEAKGALNFLDDHYVMPFCFSRDNGNGNYTFFIEPKRLQEEFVHNKEFRKLIESGRFVYVEGCVCVNHPDYVYFTSKGPQLTSWANAHVDKCCLRFRDVYEQDEITGYRLGRLNSDEEYNKHYMSFPGCANEDQPIDRRREELSAYIRSLRALDFSEMLVKLMKDADVTVEKMVEVTGISDSTIKRLRKSQKDVYSIDQIIGIIICLHLSPMISYLLLDRAGFHLEGNPMMMAYSMIVNLHFMDPLQNVQKRIVEYGHAKLKLRDDDAEVA